MDRKSNQWTTRIAILGIAALGLGLSACATTSSEDAADDTTSSTVTGSDFEQGDMPADDGGESSMGDADIELGTVYFDFDRSEIRADARPILRANADALKGTGANVTIEGHCDNRGSEEYNQALGERRASAVKRYLEDLGVANSQIRTVSYGETRPAVQGSGESAWRYNRNATFALNR